MRDPNRIDSITDKMNQLWKLAPDQRLGQLIDNILHIGFLTDYNLSLIEDDKFEKLLDLKIAEWTTKK